MEALELYLRGAFHQGTGDLGTAMTIFRDPRFEIAKADAGRSIQQDVSLLAAMNLLYIRQHPSYRDNPESARILDDIRPLCQDHHDPEIRNAFNLILATIVTDPPLPLNQVKNSMSLALNGSKRVGNQQTLAMALNIMRCRLFENVIGEQALKSAKAASTQAKRSGNLLWMSVADGMLADSHQVQGQLREAKAARDSGTKYGCRALGEDI
jgi:hypothetical protein